MAPEALDYSTIVPLPTTIRTGGRPLCRMIGSATVSGGGASGVGPAARFEDEGGVAPMLARRAIAAWILIAVGLLTWIGRASADDQRRLYVAVPGIRNYLEYGGHGLLVFDIDDGHKLLKRIPTAGLAPDGTPDNVKGICASAETGRVYISTIHTLTCLDLDSETILWEREYEGDCDRMAIAPDGQTIYLPSFEKDHWNVIEALGGDVIARVVPHSGSHNTVYGPDGRHAYLAGLKSPLLTVTNTSDHRIAHTVGPFSAPVRPFTINARQSLCFVNVNGLLGFEVGDLLSGEKLFRVEIEGFEKGPVKRHGCPSHGIGLTPDEKELWVCDAHNQRLHIFDATRMPPKQVASLSLRDEPGWVTFSLDGAFAYPSTGEVIDTATRRVVATLADEAGGPVMSEKVVEIQFQDGKAVRTGDQFGIGRAKGR